MPYLFWWLNSKKKMGLNPCNLGVTLGLCFFSSGVLAAEREILEVDSPAASSPISPKPLSPSPSIPAAPSDSVKTKSSLTDLNSAKSDSLKQLQANQILQNQIPPKPLSTQPDSAAPPQQTVKNADSLRNTPVTDISISENTEITDTLLGDNESAYSIEVDSSLGKNREKSLALALFASAVFPGAGETYLQEKNRGRAFMLVDVGFWAGLIVSLWAKESYLQSARNQASEFAGIDASNKTESFLNTMSSYRSYLEKEHRQDSYELTQILSGKRERDYEIKPTPENYWDFGSSNTPQNTRNWKTFQSTLRYYRTSKVAFSFAVGGLALNRVASLANTLHIYRSTSSHGLGLQIWPEIGPDRSGATLAIAF